MNGAALFKGRSRALIADIPSLFIILLAVVLSLVLTERSRTKQEGLTVIAMVNEDAGDEGSELISLLEQEPGYRFAVVPRDEALRMLARSEAHCMFIIKPDFSERLKKGEYEDLIEARIYHDSPGLTTETELMINTAIKLYSKEIAVRDMEHYTDLSEEELTGFEEEVTKIFQGESLLLVEDIPYGESTAQEEELAADSIGVRIYAAMTLFYLLLGGSWMRMLIRGKLLKRFRNKGVSPAYVFFFEALPGILAVTAGFIPVALFWRGLSGLLLLPAFLLYAAGSLGLALIIVSLCSDFGSLIFAAPLCAATAAFVSGLIVDLPVWAGIWDLISVVLPGHWIREAFAGRPFLWGAVLCAVAYLFAGFGVSYLCGKKEL